MTTQVLLVSRVQMPERGQFCVRVDDDLVHSGMVASGTRGRFVVMLDYGEDVGQVIETMPYDPAVHGSRIPGFRLIRPLDEADAKTLQENEKLAVAMRNAFLTAAKDRASDLKIPSARLSFGRKRLFLRYVSPGANPDLSAAQEFLARQFGVEVNLWAMGPRDEVAEIGGLGPCGRVCCCCSWQRRFPSHLAVERLAGQTPFLNGTCGRYKCCFAFEREGNASGAVSDKT